MISTLLEAKEAESCYMNKQIPLTFTTAITSDGSCAIFSFDVTREIPKGTDGVQLPVGEKLVDLHLKATLV